MSEIPAFPGELDGYRAWWINVNGGLQGLWHAAAWYASETKATCNASESILYYIPTVEQANKRTRHAAPQMDCECGLYAHKTPDGAVKSAQGATLVHHDDRLAIGRVALWGRVIEHERGYRAQFARIVWALVPKAQLGLVQARYPNERTRFAPGGVNEFRQKVAE